MMNFKRVQMSLIASVNKTVVQLYPHPDNQGFSKSWLLAVYPCFYKTTYCCLFSLPDSSCVLVSPFGTFSVPILWVQLPITPSEAAYGIKYRDPQTNYKPRLGVTQDMCLLQQKCISEVLKAGVIFVFHQFEKSLDSFDTMNVNIFHNNITEYLYYSTFLYLKLSVHLLSQNKK